MALFMLGLLVAVAWPGDFHVAASATSPSVWGQSALSPQQRGTQHYEAGQYQRAIDAWLDSLRAYRLQADTLGQARVLSNLALAYQQLGQWEQAKGAIATCFTLLDAPHSHGEVTEELRVRAQVLNNQGSLLLAQGQTETALLHWQQAESVYTQIDSSSGVIRSRINQAQALENLGFLNQALEILQGIPPSLPSQPDSRLNALALRREGSILSRLGQFEQARQSLRDSLAIAQRLGIADEIAQSWLSLGNVERSQENYQLALQNYQQASLVQTSVPLSVRIGLARLSLLLVLKDDGTARLLWPELLQQLNQLPSSRTAAFSHISLANSLMTLRSSAQTLTVEDVALPAMDDIEVILTRALEMAQTIGDQRASSYSLGSLGRLYEEQSNWALAKDLTEEALVVAQSLNAADISYQWQWQLGRILKQQGDLSLAKTAYSSAIQTVETLRGDLVAVSPDLRFDFADSVEPIYRELVSLLLPANQPNVPIENLNQARDTIESLQIAQLDNFFQEACSDIRSVSIDDIDANAAIIYPILLEDRLEIILRLPSLPLKRFTIATSKSELEEAANNLRQTLVIRSRRTYVIYAQQLYDWLIQPLITDLKANHIETLVFVLDGPLRNLPMATLSDGEHFLIEEFGVSVSPGLNLLNPRSLALVEPKALAAGVTQTRQGFAALDFVASELSTIKQLAPESDILLDQAFTKQAIQDKISSSSFPIVHIATHGQFSSKFEETFILAWDGAIDVFELERLTRGGRLEQKAAIELLILSACETAAGDQKAALGMAGLAVRSGARSTLATLWLVNDEATSTFMKNFYQALIVAQKPRVEALRYAQRTLIQDPLFSHPFYWAPYTLLGSWL